MIRGRGSSFTDKSKKYTDDDDGDSVNERERCASPVAIEERLE
jgi:hypothetical protein